MAHWLDKAPPPPADAERNFISRTIGLADILRSHVKNHSVNDAGYLGNEEKEKVNEIAEYLKKHPDILQYEFNEQGYLNKIVVNPQWMSFLKDSIERKCNMSSAIVKILQKYATYMCKEMKYDLIDVEMADVKDCRNNININGGKSRRRSKRKASKRKASKRKASKRKASKRKCKASRRK
jgi:hypothetical protein